MAEEEDSGIGIKMLADHLVKVKQQYEGRFTVYYGFMNRTDKQHEGKGQGDGSGEGRDEEAGPFS